MNSKFNRIAWGMDYCCEFCPIEYSVAWGSNTSLVWYYSKWSNFLLTNNFTCYIVRIFFIGKKASKCQKVKIWPKA